MTEAEGNLNFDPLEALQVIECPVCLETLYSPVFQCANGHLICSSCLDQVDICPICRKQMPSERIRCLAVENLVSLKCPNFKWGCKEWLTLKDKANHALTCKYSFTNYCRRLELMKLGVHCNKMISKLDLPQHMKDEHKLTVIENNEALISQELDIRKLNCQRKWRPVLFSAFDDIFFLDCEIIHQLGSSGATISWKCISTGSVSNVQQFFVTMKLYPTDLNEMGISLKWKGKVISIDQLDGMDLNSFSLTMNTLREHTISKALEKLSWKMHVVIQKNSSIACISNPAAPAMEITSVELAPSICQILAGTYKYVSGSRRWDSKHDIVYSRNGSRWKRKGKNHLEYSFTFGQEVTFQYNGYEYKSTITVENNKLIHREKEYLNGKFQGDVTKVEEFSGDKMVTTDSWDGKSYTSVYKKLNG